MNIFSLSLGQMSTSVCTLLNIGIASDGTLEITVAPGTKRVVIRHSSPEPPTVTTIGDKKDPPSDAKQVVDDGPTKDLMKQHILTILKVGDTMRALDIAHGVLGNGARIKQVNPALYELAQSGFLFRHDKTTTSGGIWWQRVK